MASVSAERSRSLWMDSPGPAAPPLTEDVRADVAVVGSGIAGLSTAYEIAAAGGSVVVLDRGPIGRGMTARTTAHLASALDDRYFALVDKHGRDVAAAAWRSQAAAIDRIEAIQQAEGIACSFARLPGYLFPAEGGDPSELEKERDACRDVGLTGVELTAATALPGRPAALRFPDQARFHPLRYIDGLAAAVVARGGRLFARTVAKAIGEESGAAVVTTASGQRVTAGAVVIATNGPINDKVTIFAKEAPFRTFAIAARVARGSVEDALFWDTGDPYHYVRLHPDGDSDWLISGGEDYATASADDGEERVRRLEAWTRERFPSLGPIAFRWSGQVMEPADYLGFIGLYPGSERTYVVTGDSGQGMTHGALAGLILAGLIREGSHEWASIYDPGRKSVGTLTGMVSSAAAMVSGLAEKVTPGDLSSADELKPGEGGILRHGLDKLALFRNEAGDLRRMSASCTHAGCVVAWNSFERCWDCPCHGSHFAAEGEAINGPAIAPLKPAG